MNAVSLQRYDANELPDVRWKNGCGTTRELVCRPQGSGLHDFDWRVSIATIAGDAAFSAFPGVDRCIVLLQGGGVRLLSSGAGAVDHRLDVPYAPFRFDGDITLRATLLAGPSTDFNAMTRRGRCRADVAVLRAPSALGLPPRGLVHAAEGEWMIEGANVTVALNTGQGAWWDGVARADLRVSPGQAGTAAVLLVVGIESDTPRAPTGTQ